jgi:transcriptional regulator with XRE-family HTH domain
VVLRPAADTLAGIKLSQFSARLLQERHVLGMTLMDLHDETGITIGRLSRLEKGVDTNPTIGTMVRLAEGLGIVPLVIFAGPATA